MACCYAEASGEKRLALLTADGSSRQLLPSGRNPRHPAWSPDGRFIAFSAQAGDTNRAVFVVPSRAGPARKLTGETSAEARPHWSADGRAIYFQSDRAGVQGVYRVDWPSPGTPEPVVSRGVEAMESSDGSRLYILTNEQEGQLLCRRVNGGQDCSVPQTKRIEPGKWGCVRDGIFYAYSPEANVALLALVPYDANGNGNSNASTPKLIATLNVFNLLGIDVDWSGQRMFWARGEFESMIHLGRGFS